MELKFIRSPLYDNWFSNNKPEKSILICTPYLKNDVVERLIADYCLSKANSKIEVTVLIRGTLEDFIQGSSDISALESLIKIKNIVRIGRLTNLHMKAYLIDGEKLMIGSGNFTRSGLFTAKTSGNVEGGIYTTDTKVIKEFLAYYGDIVPSSEPVDEFYSKLVEDYKLYIDSKPKSPIERLGNKTINTIKHDERKSRYQFDILSTGLYKNVSFSTSGKRKANQDINTNQDSDFTKDILETDIPQYSKFIDGTIGVVEIIINEENRGLTFLEMGALLENCIKTAAEYTHLDKYKYRKYGENHSKLAELLDLVTITVSTPRKIYLTKLGELFYISSSSERNTLLVHQILRMSIVKDIIVKASSDTFNLLDYLLQYFEVTTAKRRRSNVRRLFQFLIDNNVEGIDIIYDKL